MNVTAAAQEKVRGRSKEAARLFHDLMSAAPQTRRRFLASLTKAELAQVLAVAAREGGTPYYLWADDPVGFIEDVLGESLWSKPREILQALATKRRVAVPSCFDSGKCVYGKEMVMLSTGALVQAEDLVGKEFEMIGWAEDGTQTIRKARASWNAIEPIYRVVTDSGREIIRNGAHPLWAADNVRGVRSGGEKGTVIRTPENIGWRAIQELAVDDLVLVPEKVSPRAVERVRFEEAALLGYLLGDGHTGREVRFTHLTGEGLDEFVACVEALGGQVKPSGAQDRAAREVVVRTLEGGELRNGHRVNPIWDLVQEWGMAGKKATEKRFPNFVWRLQPGDLAVILGRLFACDGYATTRDGGRGIKIAVIGIDLANEGLIRDVQRAMLRLGIPGTVRRKYTKVNGQPYPVWSWTITSAEPMRRFVEQIYVPDKMAKFREVAEYAATRRHTHLWRHRNCPPGYRWEKIKEIERLPDAPTVAIEVDDDHTWVDLFVEHNSWSASRCALWYAYTNPIGVAKVVTIAPLWRQVVRQLWPEIRRAHSRAGLPGVVDAAQLKMTDSNGLEVVVAYGMSAAPYNEAAVQGIHSPRLLLLVDEAGGISPIIGRNLRAALVGEGTSMLAIGNPPTDDEGSWFEVLCSLDSVVTIPIDAFETPNLSGEVTPRCRSCPDEVPEHAVASHLVDKEWVHDTIAEHGEDSNYVQAKVFARFPKGGPSRVLPAAWVDAAADAEEPENDHDMVRLCDLGLLDETEQWLVRRGAWIRLGVDVASDGGDEFVVARCVGDLVTIQHIGVGAENANATDVAGVVLREINRAEALREALDSTAPIHVKVDSIGIGWGVAGVLQAWGSEELHAAKVIAVDVREKTEREPDIATLRPYRKRDEMWLAMRALLQPRGSGAGAVRLRLDRRTLAQLRAPQMSINPSGYTVIESKKSMRDRGISSPDRAEAVLLSVYEPHATRKKKKKARLIVC